MYKMRCCCSYYIFAVTAVMGEIITLKEKDNITCVLTGTNSDSAVYLNPPTNSDFIKGLNKFDKWLSNDWQENRSLDFSLSTVTDKRWEEFRLLTEIHGFALKNNILSFSLWNPKNTILRIMNEDNNKETLINISYNDKHNINEHDWVHYNIYKNNHTLYIRGVSMQEPDTYYLDFEPYWFYIQKTSQNVTWKLHDYSFRHADKISKQKSVVGVNFEKNLCLSMYVSVDTGSFLDINLENNKENSSKKVIGFNKPNNIRTWQKVEISAKNHGEGKLSIFRGRQQPGESDGFWAIRDINFCSQNTELYRVQVKERSNANYVCQVLSDDINEAKEEQSILTCEKPGFLGKNCDVSCEYILGSDYPNCEKQKICLSDSTCFCSSGFQGQFCEQTCANGTWGLFCQNMCHSEECENCHPSTGECLDPKKRTLSENFISTVEMETTLVTSSDVDPIELDLPSNVTFRSNEINIYSSSNKTVTYNVKYLCVSDWCKNSLFKGDNVTVEPTTNHTNLKVKNLLPFTKYQPIINILNQNLDKKYNIFTTENESSSDVTNLSVYSSNGSTLWVKFQIPDISNNDLSRYKIWYPASDNQTPKNVFRCGLWDDFVCGKIDNLEANQTYFFTVEENYEGKVKYYFIKKGFTAEKESEAPKNLRVLRSSNYTATLAWNHPSTTNGPLQKFIVYVSTKIQNKTYEYHVENEQRTYVQKISVEYDIEHNISVRGMNKYEGGSISISTLILSIPELSSENVIRTSSSNRSILLIPKPNEFKNRNCNLIIRKENSDRDLTPLTNNFETYLEIEGGSEKSFDFLEDKIHPTYIVIKDNNEKEMVYKIHEEEITLRGTAKMLMMIIIPVAMLILSLLLLLLLALTKKNIFKLPSRNLDFKEKHKLMSNKNCEEKFTKIQILNLESYLKSTATVGKDLVRQFRSLPQPTKPTVHASHNKNKNKNRYRHYIPYDHSRVILEYMEGMGADDYINASYINGIDHPNVYIATQGPKFSTIRDFWRMVWQEKVETIVMATNFTECKERKCAEYFPLKVNTIFDCGAMSIRLVKEECYENHNKRLLDIYYKKYSRRVQHFHLKWNPDDNTPLYADRVAPFLKQISRIRERSTTPIVVHCSSGTNRTGTIILCDLALQVAKSENCVDFYTLLKNMRNQRPHMICTEKQYVLAHLIVLECLTDTETIFQKSLKKNLNPHLLKLQLDHLEKLHDHDKIVQSWASYSTILDDCSYKSTLVDGYAVPRKYLVVQQPTPNSLLNFWNFMYKTRIPTMVFLNKVADQLWPYSNQFSQTTFTVKELHSFKSEVYDVTKLLLVTIHTPTNQIMFEHQMTLLQLHDENNILNIIDDVHEMCHNTTPLLVACNDGITNCGLFVTFSYFIEKYRNELAIDMCSAIRTVRRSGTKYVKTKDELIFLYTAASQYIKTVDHYTFMYS